jgi:hypothetical protein
MVEVSDGKQWRIAGVLLLDLLCSRALHVVLVGASVIEPENRRSVMSFPPLSTFSLPKLGGTASVKTLTTFSSATYTAF